MYIDGDCEIGGDVSVGAAYGAAGGLVDAPYGTADGDGAAYGTDGGPVVGGGATTGAADVGAGCDAGSGAVGTSVVGVADGSTRVVAGDAGAGHPWLPPVSCAGDVAVAVAGGTSVEEDGVLVVAGDAGAAEDGARTATEKDGVAALVATGGVGVAARGAAAAGTEAVGASAADGAGAGFAKRLVMPSTKSNQDDSPWSFSKWRYHCLAAPLRSHNHPDLHECRSAPRLENLLALVEPTLGIVDVVVHGETYRFSHD
jgi:hypothetical protein